MGFEAAISALGLGGLIADEVFLAQIGLMAVSSILFLSSIIVCAMAFRAAGAARRARREALDLAVEVRHLTAQVEKAAHRGGAPSRSEEPAAALSASGEGEPSGKTEAAETEVRTLEEAKNAATVPSALLRRMVRRRP